MNIESIAIIGATDLGCAIARAAAWAGYATTLEDVSALAVEQGVARITQALDSDGSSGKLDRRERELALARIGTASSAEEACRMADLVIEAVADEEEMKLELFTIFDKFAKPDAIFATTTAKFSVTELAAITVCPERCIGMRFLPDAKLASSIELKGGRETSGETIVACSKVARRLGFDARVVGDGATIAAQSR